MREPSAARSFARFVTGLALDAVPPYLVAVMIVRGRAGLAEFTDEAVRDETVLRLARCVTYEIDPTIDYPRHFIGDVRARLRDGREVVERQEHPRGGPDHPMSREELTAKFRGNAALLLPADRVEAVVKHAADLRDQLRLDPLMQALADPAPAR